MDKITEILENQLAIMEGLTALLKAESPRWAGIEEAISKLEKRIRSAKFN